MVHQESQQPPNSPSLFQEYHLPDTTPLYLSTVYKRVQVEHFFVLEIPRKRHRLQDVEEGS